MTFSLHMHPIKGTLGSSPPKVSLFLRDCFSCYTSDHIDGLFQALEEDPKGQNYACDPSSVQFNPPNVPRPVSVAVQKISFFDSGFQAQRRTRR
jgi:hypothetical protein